MRIPRSEVPRLERLAKQLETVRFPYYLPGAHAPLGFVDKFRKTHRDYTLTDVAPPSLLYFRGRDAGALNPPLAVGFGGTVSPTADGFQAAILLAQIVAQEGGTVVGGGVIGVDTAAHLGALDIEGGRTIAVLANDVEHGIHPYVPRRTFLEDAIIERGGLVSEYLDYSDERQDRLLARDRIITALCDVFVVIECGVTSATVDAAKRAYIQGRSVFAGISSASNGTNPNRMGIHTCSLAGLQWGFPRAKSLDGRNCRPSSSLSLNESGNGRLTSDWSRRRLRHSSRRGSVAWRYPDP